MKTALVILLLSLSAAGQVRKLEDGWKGIKTFESTRAEVEKILASPYEELWDIYTAYHTEIGNVTIVYSASPCSNAKAGKGRYNLPADRVISYMVFFKGGIPLKDLVLSKDKYERLADSHRRGHFYLYKPDAGLTLYTEVTAEGERVWSLDYNGTESQVATFTCPPAAVSK